MSAGSPSNFSFQDLKLLIAKKEKTEETSSKAPIDVSAPKFRPPITRSKTSSAKKHKASDTTINVDSFEGLPPVVAANKHLSLQVVVNIGIDKLSHEVIELEGKLEAVEQKREASELKLDEALLRIEQMGKIAASKNCYHEKQLNDQEAAAAEALNLAEQNAKSSAAISVLECMIEMAKSAQAEGFTPESWPVKDWEVILKRLMAERDETAEKVAKEVEPEVMKVDKETGAKDKGKGKEVKQAEAAGVKLGDEGILD